MEGEQKMKIEEMRFIKKEPIEIDPKVETVEPKEEKMHVDIKNDDFNENMKPLKIGTKPVGDGIFELKVEGISDDDNTDDDEDFIIMTPEEISTFLKLQIAEDVKDCKINPLLALQKRNKELLEEAEEKATEVARLDRALNRMYKNQEKFLRHMDILPKIPTKEVAVNVDLPLIGDYETITSNSASVVYRKEGDCFIKEDLLDAKVLTPSAADSKSSDPRSSSAVSSPSTNPVATSASNISSSASVPNTSSVASSNPNASLSASNPTANSTAAVSNPTANSTAAVSNPTANSTAAVSNPTANSTAAVSNPTANSTAAVSNPTANSTAAVSNTTSGVKSQPKPASNIECIDLTDDTPVASAKSITSLSTAAVLSLVKHPAPLPPKPFCASNNARPNVPPKPRLKIYSEERGIVLEWDMPPNTFQAAVYAKLDSFDIFGYQEQKDVVINTLLWKKIGSVKAMNLPMACTLTQFLEGQKYHFSVRAVDVLSRCGAYSDPISIVFKPHSTKKA